jgi:hypothetical protein
VVLLAMATAAHAQQPATADVEVDPINCWWRTSTSAVRMGEPFGLTLTCSVVDAESMTVVPDLSRLDPTVVQLPPFEILGGTHPADIVTPGRRFFQYDYRLRFIGEDLFGADAVVPPLEISYRVESKVEGGDTVQGRDLTYALPRASIKVISLVPGDTTDIRESPATPFSAIEGRLSRANLLQTVAMLLVALAGLIVLVLLVGLVRRRAALVKVVQTHVHARTILGAVSSELADVQRHSRGGWSPELVGRALAALRIAGSYAAGRAVGQAPVEKDSVPLDGQLRAGAGFGRAGAWASGSVTAESAGDVPGLASALRTLTVARYGRPSEGSAEPSSAAMDEAVDTAIRLAKQEASRHSHVSEWLGHIAGSMTDFRKKVWS